MGTRIGGNRRKTRSTLGKPKRKQGKISLRSFFQQLEPGQRVAFKAEPAVQHGLYFRRFHGKVGIVERKLGSCYEIVVDDRGKQKHLIVHPVHLKAIV